MTSQLDDLIRGAALLVTAAGIVVSAGALVATRSYSPALPILLDFLMAAGLLRLASSAQWHVIVAAAGIVAVRKVTMIGIGTAARAQRRHPSSRTLTINGGRSG